MQPARIRVPPAAHRLTHGAERCTPPPGGRDGAASCSRVLARTFAGHARELAEVVARDRRPDGPRAGAAPGPTLRGDVGPLRGCRVAISARFLRSRRDPGSFGEQGSLQLIDGQRHPASSNPERQCLSAIARGLDSLEPRPRRVTGTGHLWPDSWDRTRASVVARFSETPEATSRTDRGREVAPWPRTAGQWVRGGELACTPDSVPGPCGTGGDHPSRPAVACRLQRSTRKYVTQAPRGRAVLSLYDLAPSGVYRAARVTPGAGALLPHRFTLTCAGRLARPAIGGLFSVALSCGSPRLGVTQHLALWSPDVPRTGRSPHAAARPTRHHRPLSRSAVARPMAIVRPGRRRRGQCQIPADHAEARRR